MTRCAMLLAGLAVAALAVGCGEGPEPPKAAPPAPAAGQAPDALVGALVGTEAPEIEAAYWLNSDPLTLQGLRGQIVVVEFWATWCPPCRQTIPHLIELHTQYAGKGVVIVSLTDEPKETVAPFVKEMGMPYAVGGGSKTGRAYGVQGIPSAAVIDPAGKVVWQGHPMGGLDAALAAQVKAAAK
ncbi:MAG: TlpA family protein disulfide reductase [Planctomycetes bacterium]|nr:TlpA family protein disulfide reductase [Planctomycetota bacterium]